MRTLLIALALAVLSGSECERERLDDLDHGFLEVDDCTLYQGIDPFAVAIDATGLDDDQIEELRLAVEYADARCPGGLMYEGTEVTPGFEGWVSISVSALPDSLWDEPGPGGVALPVWDLDCGIVSCEIIIDYEHAYDLQTLRDRTLHELGHCPFGLAHDGDSLDLGSCMSSPPAWDCDYTDRDVERLGGE
jgi:hypothetical protein